MDRVAVTRGENGVVQGEDLQTGARKERRVALDADETA